MTPNNLSPRIKLILMDKTNPIDWMKSMYETYSTTRIFILMNEKKPNRWKFSLLMNETIG
jgi:hypothetical protein